MTEENKKLLFRDLCARLPYGVICFAPDYEYGDIGKLWCIEPFEDLDPQITVQYPKGNTITKFCSEVKPYLRPMSSMTEEERDEFRNLGGVMSHNVQNDTWALSAFSPEAYDWLLEHHFDIHDLIKKGLAIEAPEGMYA